MSKLVEIITSSQAEIRNTPLEKVCSNVPLSFLIEESKQLDLFRKNSGNLYHKVRALFFLYAIHRFYIPQHQQIDKRGLIPYEAYDHMLKRRFEEAIEMFLSVQADTGANEGISSGLAEAYHKLAFQTLADQVRLSVRSTRGNQWMFRVGHPLDQPLKINRELTYTDNCTGLFPILHETTPVRMDLSHSGWSDIFFLGMDFPEGAKVLNISVDLEVKTDDTNNPKPPIETFFRVIDQPVIKLTSVDLKASTTITELNDIFDFAKDYLGLLKAALIASGLIPPGMEGSHIPLSELLDNMLGKNMGIELVSKVNNIPKGSRLAVSTNLLASLISVCMRATSQTKSLSGTLQEDERRLVAARAILGEWLGGSGGGWQDSGGVWPGIKVIKGIEAEKHDPEYGVSRGRLLPQHTIFGTDLVSKNTRNMLQKCLVMVHGGMAQDVGPILEMVTEKYLLRNQKEWKGRMEAIKYFDKVIENIQEGNVEEIGKFTNQNFFGPLRTIIPWTSNIYTETIINTIQTEFGKNFWGFWMMGGMSGGGMGFIFHPDYKNKGQKRLLEIMQQAKNKLEHAIPFAMDPVVYNFKINNNGTFCEILTANKAMMPSAYYTINTPALLRSNIKQLTKNQRAELEALGKATRKGEALDDFIPKLFEQMLPQGNSTETEQQSLDDLLIEFGFNPELHQQIKSDLKIGRIGLAQNRLPSSYKINDVAYNELTDTNKEMDAMYLSYGEKSIESGQVGIITLAGGAGSRWTKGAGVIKALNPFAFFNGQHRNFVEIHLAKSKKINTRYNCKLPHIFTTSYLTHNEIANYLQWKNNFGYNARVYLSQGKSIGQRLIPTIRDLKYLWEEMPQQILDEQAQKVRDSQRNALLNWAQTNGEAEDYTDNLPHQCIHPVGHWFEIPNMFLNGTLNDVLEKQPNLKFLLIHNIDTLGANIDPKILGYHILSGSIMSCEVITRKIDDRGGGLASIDGKTRLIEGLALPNEKVEFNLSYYNTNNCWIDIDKILSAFQLTRRDLNSLSKVKSAVNAMAQRIPTYITIKDVKKRWGKGQEDIFPIIQWEKLWGDMTALSEMDCKYLLVSRMRGQQLKEPAQLDGWLRDGSARYVEELCEFGG